MKKKITITAEDNIGRTESITMKLSEYAVERLKKADMQDTLETELARLYDDYKMGYKTEISRTQYYALRDFYNLIYHKFYNYTFSIE